MSANHITLSSGQVLFADPTKSWTPANFPQLPSTNISLTAVGSIETRNISTLSLSNAISYTPYEQSYKGNLSRSFLIEQSGQVKYAEPTVGIASTQSAAFMDAQVTSFSQAVTGGPGIKDATQTNPDTITNALAKVDAWITEAFLKQPPGITPIQAETNSIYGGVRWLNFNSYSLLNEAVPGVNGIVFIVGDPATPNYCTFEFKDPNYFPYKTYRDGLSPQYTPLVRLRIFSDCFVASADTLYTKAVMQTKCVRLISEAGAATFPAQGKCFAIENTDNESTYTTISIYLPNLATAYPKGSPVPVRIAYLNKTEGGPIVTQTSTIQATSGAPSALSSITSLSATPATVTLQLGKPIFVDTTAQLSTPFLSSYQVKYTLTGMNVAPNAVVGGFRYGIATPATIPTEFINYTNSTFTQNFTYTSPLQSVTAGTTTTPLLPGARWSTSVAAYNSGRILGVDTPGPRVSTLFPATTTPKINTMVLKAATPEIRVANTGALNYIQYNPANSAWSITTNVSTDVLFLSTGLAQVQTSSFVQWNDASFPGDRSTITAFSILRDPAGITTTPVNFQLSSFNNDFPLQSLQSKTQGTNSCFITLTDSQTAFGYEKYFYNAAVKTSQTVTTASLIPHTLRIGLSNYTLPSSEIQVLSSQTYVFQTEPYNPTVTTDIQFNNVVTSTVQVAGLYTPSPNSEFLFEVQGSNSVHNFAGAEFVATALQLGPVTGPTTNNTSNIVILSNTTLVSSAPFPQNTTLRFSTCSAIPGPAMYNDPNDPQVVSLVGTLTPANPQSAPTPYVSSLTARVFLDTVSVSANVPQRIVSLVPNSDLAFTEVNINDGIDNVGNTGAGLNTSISSFYTVDSNSQVLISSAILYQHTSSLSTVYTSFYSRELLYTNGQFVHPAGYDFSQFSGALIGVPAAIYPNFTYDQIYDENYGYRYASFALDLPTFDPPESYLYLNIRMRGVSGTGVIGNDRSVNNYFPSEPVLGTLSRFAKVRIHTKLVGVNITETYQTFETAWLNCTKQADPFTYSDDVYDIGACVDVSVDGPDVVYKIQINRRFYQKICAFVRIGIAQDGSQYSGSPITFTDITVSPSDI
jgi:hypothetical protein